MKSAAMPGIWVSAVRVAAPRTTIESHLFASGAGATRAQAEIRCLYEAIERYSLVSQADIPVMEASVKQIGEDVASAALLNPFSARQYAQRDDWNRRYGGTPYIPPRLPPDAAIRWSPCWSLNDGRSAWAPAELVRMGSAAAGGVSYFVCDSTGCAAHPDLAQATLRALLESIERDAVAIWWYNRIEHSSVAVDSSVPEYRPWLRFLRAARRDYCLFDITTDIGIPVIAAVTWDRKGRCRSMGFGCHPSIPVAAQAALREACQTSIGAKQRGSSVFETPYLKPLREGGAIPPPSGELPNTAEMLRTVLDALRRAGLEPWIVPLTRPELEIPVVRILCGGLRHPGHRLAAGRLYDVPVKMKWRKAALTELEMNPEPCVF